MLPITDWRIFWLVQEKGTWVSHCDYVLSVKLGSIVIENNHSNAVSTYIDLESDKRVFVSWCGDKTKKEIIRKAKERYATS